MRIAITVAARALSALTPPGPPDRGPPRWQRIARRDPRRGSRRLPKVTRCTSKSCSACLIDDGLVRQAADEVIREIAEDLSEIRIPASISALISARLERLPHNELDVAERASVVGRVFEQAAVTELAIEALRAEVGRSIAALVRKEFVRPEHSELSAGDVFEFRHILIRDAAYEAIPKSGRAILHERYAGWLESRSAMDQGDYDLIVGYHLEQAYRYRTELRDERSGHDRPARGASPALHRPGRKGRAGAEGIPPPPSRSYGAPWTCRRRDAHAHRTAHRPTFGALDGRSSATRRMASTPR